MKGCSKTKTSKNNRSYVGGDNRLAYPNKGVSGGFNFLNPQTGGCNGQCSIMKGGKNTCTCQKGCDKKTCPCQKGGANLPYPNGLLGNAWTPSISGWPGVGGISMDRNHLGYNTYKNDVSRQILNLGANPPFTYLKGGKRRKRSSTYKRIIKRNNNKNKKRKSKTQKGGISNFVSQDLINVGRQLQYGVGSAYNGIRGYTSPVNPLPWKDQYK